MFNPVFSLLPRAGKGRLGSAKSDSLHNILKKLQDDPLF